MGELVRGVLLPDLPRGIEPGRPGHDALSRQLERLGADIAGLQPDAIVLATGHWVTTFHHYVAGAARFDHGDAADAREALAHPGHPALARALVAAGRAGRVPAILTEEPGVPLDAGDLAVVNGLRVPADLPIVPVSLCYLADLGETLRWGRAIAAAVRRGPWRVALAVAEPRAPATPEPGPLRWERPEAPGPVPALPRLGRRTLLQAGAAAVPRHTGLATARQVALLTGALGAGGAGVGGDAATAALAGSRMVPGLSPN